MMPFDEEASDDPRLEYLPCILIIATNGLELDLLLPPTPTSNIHWGQAWKPIICQCGGVHTPCDAADLTVVLGQRDRTIHHHPDSFVVYVLPRPMRRLPKNAAQVIYGGSGGFGAWAADVVENLVGPQSDPSFWRYTLVDLQYLLGLATSWSCVSATESLTSAAETIVSLIPPNAHALHVSIAVPDDSDVYMTDIGEFMKAVANRVRSDTSIIFSSAWGARLRITALCAT